LSKYSSISREERGESREERAERREERGEKREERGERKQGRAEKEGVWGSYQVQSVSQPASQSTHPSTDHFVRSRWRGARRQIYIYIYMNIYIYIRV